MERRLPADRIDHWPVLSSVHIVAHTLRNRRIHTSNHLFLFAHSTQIHSGEIDSRVTFISIPSICKRYTFAPGGSAAASAGSNSGTSRRATPTRLSAIP